MFNSRRPNASLRQTEKGYSWLFFTFRRVWVFGCLVTLLVIGAGSAFFLWYSYNGDDLESRGNVGLSYAIAGLTFLILAAIAYTVRRRIDKPALGQLNRALNWHVFFAMTGLVLLFLHSFGDFEIKSGFYALLSMVALTLSGLLGRLLDRILAWRIAIEASIILTVEGEDRVETIIEEAQSAAPVPPNRPARRSSPPQSAPAPVVQRKRSWDLAYSSLEKRTQESLPPGPQSRPLLDGEPLLARPLAAQPTAQKQMAALQEIQQAMQREQLYHAIIRNWRKVHLALALLTLGVTAWHIIIEMPFLYHAFFH